MCSIIFPTHLPPVRPERGLRLDRSAAGIVYSRRSPFGRCTTNGQRPQRVLLRRQEGVLRQSKDSYRQKRAEGFNPVVGRDAIWREREKGKGPQRQMQHMHKPPHAAAAGKAQGKLPLILTASMGTFKIWRNQDGGTSVAPPAFISCTRRKKLDPAEKVETFAKTRKLHRATERTPPKPRFASMQSRAPPFRAVSNHAGGVPAKEAPFHVQRPK